MRHHLPFRSGTGRLAGGLAVCLAASAAWAAGAGSVPSRAAGCTDGVTTISGAAVRIWCGPAKAIVRVGAKTYRFTHGQCVKTAGFTGGKVLAVNIGMQTIPPASPKRFYFGALVEKVKPGRYLNQAVGWQVPGKGDAALVNVVVVGKGLRTGSFRGTTTVEVKGSPTPKKIPVSGSWTC